MTTGDMMSDADRQHMRDAGRGHLLGEGVGRVLCRVGFHPEPYDMKEAATAMRLGKARCRRCGALGLVDNHGKLI